MKRNSGMFCIVAVLSVCAGVHASGFIVTRHHEPDAHHPHRHSPLELTQHHLNATISEQVAVTTIEQVFRNTSSSVIEGTYYLPIPEGAQIDRFTMFIDGKETEAELLPADEARKIYEDIVRTMKDPALLEYMGCGLFKVRIFPIQPQDDARVRLTFTELLPSDAGMISYAHTFASTRHVPQVIRDFSAKLTISGAKPLKTIYSPSHDVDITRHAEGAVVGFEGRNVKPQDTFQVLYSFDTDEHDVGLSLLSFRDDDDDDGYFLLLMSPNVKRELEQEVVDKDVVFVLDTSGSMAGGKLEQAKAALRYCLNSLNEGDRFEIIEFATEARPLFQSLQDNTQDSRDDAAAFIDDLRARGGTAIDDSLRAAVSHVASREQADRPYVVIFLTDGMPTVGERDAAQIVANIGSELGDASVRIFSFGIGSDVNTRLLDKISLDTRAVSQYVLADEDIEVKVSNFYAKINDPVLANVELTFGEGVKVSRMYPSRLPDLFKGDQLVLLGRYDGSGGTAIELNGSVNGKARTLTYEASFPGKADEHEFVPRLWATRRVGFLLDQVRLNGESEELRDEIVLLARQYGIVTPYTSYLILEDEAQRNVPIARRSQQAIERGGARAREDARDSWDNFANAVSGGAAVSSSQSNTSLRMATQTQDLSEADALMRVPGAAAAPPAQQARFIRGRTFYQSGDGWIDANVQALPEGVAPVRVQFNSAEYFDLLAQHPEAGPWLAVGRNVQLVLNDVIYDIYDDEDAG